jgi:hypothetical protein
MVEPQLKSRACTLKLYTLPEILKRFQTSERHTGDKKGCDIMVFTENP